MLANFQPWCCFDHVYIYARLEKYVQYRSECKMFLTTIYINIIYFIRFLLQYIWGTNRSPCVCVIFCFETEPHLELYWRPARLGHHGPHICITTALAGIDTMFRAVDSISTYCCLCRWHFRCYRSNKKWFSCDNTAKTRFLLLILLHACVMYLVHRLKCAKQHHGQPASISKRLHCRCMQRNAGRVF